jgi:hypothetical protein
MLSLVLNLVEGHAAAFLQVKSLDKAVDMEEK